MPQAKLSAEAVPADETVAPIAPAASLEALLMLAHRGACLRRAMRRGNPATYSVLSPRNGFAKPVITLDTFGFEFSLARGWLTEHAPDEWVLSKRGVAAARRHRASGGAEKPDALEPATRHRSSGARIKLTETPLCWLRKRSDKDGRPLITAAQFEAGSKLQRDFWFAGMTPRTTSNWEAPTASRSDRRSSPACVEALEKVADARARVREALAAVGPELSGILFDICCHQVGLEDAERAAGWPQRSAKVVLQLALDSLARHYGLMPMCAGRSAQPGPLRHWGASDYRPALDGWK